MKGELMAAEMADQPGVLAHLAERRSSIVAAVARRIPHQFAGSVLIARGSSDHAAIYGRYLIELVSHRPVSLAAPSLHTLYKAEVDYSGHLAVAISQSGETPEIVTVLRRLVEAGAVGVAVTNDPASPLAEVAESVVELGAGDERAVPATKTFTAQMAAFALIAEAFGRPRWADEAWDRLSQVVTEILSDPDPAARVAGAIGDAEALVAAGRGFQFPAALEAALKLKETTGIVADGYSGADLRHGPIAVVDRGFPVLAFMSPGPAEADMRSLAGEVRRRRGALWIVGDVPDADLAVPSGLPEELAPIAAVVRAQQLARELAILRGIDPDRPLGLAKVTPTH